MSCYRRLFDLQPGSSQLDNKNSAASTFRVSDDGLIYTIVLQEGQSFSDGAAVDSQAALYSFDRLMSTKTGQLFFSPLRYLEIVGPYTFRLHLDRPWPPFLASLTTPMASLVSPSLSTRPTGYLDKASLGSGRFEVERFEGSELVMRIRQDSPSIPKLNIVEFIFAPDPAQRLKLFEERQAHMAWAPNLNSPLPSRGVIIDAPTWETKFLAFNFNRPYLKMAAAREAIGGLAQAVMGENGKLFRPRGVFPAGLAPGLDLLETEDPLQQEADSKTLLGQLGPSRIPLDLVYRAQDPSGHSDAELLAQKLRQYGLPVRVVPLDGSHGQLLLEKVDWDLFLDSRRPEFPSPEMWLARFVDSRSSISGNPGMFSDAQADNIIAELNTSDRRQRSNALRRLAALAMNQKPIVLLYQKSVAMLVDERLKDLRPHPMWPEVWPVELTNLDPFKPKAPGPPVVLVPQTPLFKEFDDQVAEPYE
jgi:ABC-type transport system substrate-binding protein